MLDNLIAWIDQRPLYYWWIGVGLVALLLGTAYYYFVYTEKGQRINGLQHEIREMRQTRDEHQKIAETLEEFRERVAKLDQQFEAAKTLLPERREIPELLAQISKLGIQAGLEFTLFKPEPEVKQEFYADVPVSVEVRGTFHEVVRFFDMVGKLPRIVNVTNFAIRDPTVTDRGRDMVLKTRGNLVTFRFLDPRELGQVEAPPGRRRRN
jgi:type IV pilus assembly protein PilO